MPYRPMIDMLNKVKEVTHPPDSVEQIIIEEGVFSEGMTKEQLRSLVDEKAVETMSEDEVQQLVLSGIAPDVEWDSLNREQRRQLKKAMKKTVMKKIKVKGEDETE